MKTIQICTYNVKNDNLGKIKPDAEIKTIYEKLLYDNNINILATQEMIEHTVGILTNSLNDYHILGKYRYDYNKIFKKIKKIRKYNEGNNIITNLPILVEKTTELPWFPRNIKEIINGTFKYKSITPRIITQAILNVEGTKVRFLNTHLSLHSNSIKKLQLRKIKKMIKSSTIPVVLTGDFNTNIEDKVFVNFINDLKTLGLKRVEINGQTFKKDTNNLAIDHIFIPISWQIKDYKIITDKYLKNYSDHYPVLVSIIIDN